jgi:hypothetical protein
MRTSRPDTRSRGFSWRRVAAAIFFSMVGAASCGSSSANENSSDACGPDDADGVNGGNAVFDLTVDDTGFSPAILAAQNLAQVTLTLHNGGTRSHDFVVDCMPTPNDNGCPVTSCLPPAASIGEIAPGASASTTFVLPNPEGIYYYHSSLAGDTSGPCMAGANGCGQFIVK